MISKFNSRSFLLIVFLVAVVLSVLIHSFWVQQSQKLKPLRIGITNWPGYDVALYAEETGLFKQRGLDVELVRFTSPPDAARALLRGALDASFMNLSVAMQADPNDDSPVFILVTDISHGSDGIVAQSNIKSIQDLKGKQITAKLGAANHLILLEALNFQKLKPQDVDIIDVPNDVAIQLMQKGEVDASAIWQPLLSKIANEINGNIIYTTKDVDTLVIDGLASRSSILNEKQSEFKQFSLAWFDLMQLVDTKPSEVFSQVGKQLGQSPEVFAKSYGGLQKGDMQLNERMFAKGRLTEAVQQLRQLLEADLRNSRTLRRDFQINPQPTLSAIEVWGEKAS
jgi:NitT/TauT family transport system substrate-binding protein